MTLSVAHASSFTSGIKAGTTSPLAALRSVTAFFQRNSPPVSITVSSYKHSATGLLKGQMINDTCLSC